MSHSYQIQNGPYEPQGNGQSSRMRESIRSAIWLHGEVARFQRAWPEPEGATRPMPPFTWEALERQLADLAATPQKAEAARTLVSATRKQARFKPAEMVLREVLEAAFVVMDEDFMPSFDRTEGSGEGEMT
jgi:hypothetical protein